LSSVNEFDTEKLQRLKVTFHISKSQVGGDIARSIPQKDMSTKQIVMLLALKVVFQSFWSLIVVDS
jgi:hypothetical protein